MASLDNLAKEQPMNPEIRKAVYAAFAYDDEEQKAVREWLCGTFNICASLEHLSWEDLNVLQDATMLYEPLTLKYVLPRWLELLTDDQPPYYELDEQWLSWRLSDEKWLQWTPKQIEVMRHVFEEWRDEELRAGHMKEFAEFINGFEEDVARYLDPWLRARPLEVAQWTWKTAWNRSSILRHWLVSPRVEEKLEEVFFRNPKGEHAQLLSDVIQLVRSLRALEVR